MWILGIKVCFLDQNTSFKLPLICCDFLIKTCRWLLGNIIRMIVTYVTTNNKQTNISVGENSLESLLHKFMCISYCGHRYARVNHIDLLCFHSSCT